MLFERLCMPDTQHVLRATCAGAHGGHCRSTLCSPTQRITQAAAGDDAHTQAHTSANALRMPLKCEFSMATRMQPLGCSTADTRAALLSCRVPSNKDPALWVHREWQVRTSRRQATAWHLPLQSGLHEGPARHFMHGLRIRHQLQSHGSRASRRVREVPWAASVYSRGGCNVCTRRAQCCSGARPFLHARCRNPCMRMAPRAKQHHVDVRVKELVLERLQHRGASRFPAVGLAFCSWCCRRLGRARACSSSRLCIDTRGALASPASCCDWLCGQRDIGT